MTRDEFRDLVLRISRKLYVISYRILRDQSGAEDAVQEVFIKLWQMNHKLDEINSIEALASTMAKNHCIDKIRRIKHEVYEYGGNAPFLNSEELTPHDIMERLETASILDRIIDKLPGTYRQLIELRDIEGLAYEDIAAQTGQNINTLRVTLSRARRTIKNEFEKYMHENRSYKKTTGKVL